MNQNEKRVYNRTNRPFFKKGEDSFGISQTIPDMAPPMREMLKRHALGLKDNVELPGSYSGDLPDYRGMEPHELDNMMLEARNQVKDLEQLYNENAIKLDDAKRKIQREQQKKTYEEWQANTMQQ